MTAARFQVEVAVWFFRLQPRRAEVAEVRVASRADHVIAAACLLRRRRARGARRRVQPHVFRRRLILGAGRRHVGLRTARREGAVPALGALVAEGERAVRADGELIATRIICRRCGRVVFPLRVRVAALQWLQKRRGLPVFWRPSRTLTPTSRTVDGVLIRFKLGLVLESNISLDDFVFEGDFQQFAGVDICPDLPLFSRCPPIGRAVLCTVGC